MRVTKFDTTGRSPYIKLRVRGKSRTAGIISAREVGTDPKRNMAKPPPPIEVPVCSYCGKFQDKPNHFLNGQCTYWQEEYALTGLCIDNEGQAGEWCLKQVLGLTGRTKQDKKSLELFQSLYARHGWYDKQGELVQPGGILAQAQRDQPARAAKARKIAVKLAKDPKGTKVPPTKQQEDQAMARYDTRKAKERQQRILMEEVNRQMLPVDFLFADPEEKPGFWETPHTQMELRPFRSHDPSNHIIRTGFRG